MPKTYSIDQAISLVDWVSDRTAGRRKRQNSDYKLQRNEPYDTNTAGEPARGTDYKSVTATIAAAFMRAVVSRLAEAKLLIQVPYGAAMRPQQELYDLKERFAYGLLEQSDEELTETLVRGSVLDQQAWFSPARGWVAGLALLRNKAGGGASPMIRPWDALNTYWQVGGNGLEWACLKTRMALGEIRSKYPEVKIDGDDGDERDTLDFWTPDSNGVFTSDREWLKPWTLHGSPRCPVVIVPVPTQPEVWSDDVTNSGDDYGESIFATNRALYEQISEVLSITLELLSKARDPSAIAFTDEEDTEFEENPQRGGGVSYMGQGDKFQPLPPPETTKDAVQFAGLVMDMIQRGDLPFTSYGQISFALSGYAITQLNQQILTVLGPQTRAIARWYQGVLNLLVDQYATNQFDPMTIRGYGNNRDYMQQMIPPLALRNLPSIRVKLVAELPQDDTAKLQAVGVAREFLPDEWLLENYLKLPDVHQVMRAMKLQQAERGHPLAVTLELARAAFESGRPDLGQVYLDQARMMSVQLQLQGLQAGGEQSQPGLPPTALPFIQAMGGVMPTPNAPTGEEGRFGLRRNR